MLSKLLRGCVLALVLSSAAPARAVSSAELYQNQTYTYGRFEARVRFAAGDGVISSFFLWKPGSEVAGTFWNELDFEKLGADCRMQTNPLFGSPVVDRGAIANVSDDLCGAYHTYTFEWTPSYIAWLIDGVQVRREVAEVAAAFEQNAGSGMQIHVNLWPGDASFGGNFDPAIMPLQQYVSWVQYSSFTDGAFVFQWREDFGSATLPAGWAVGSWASPKNLSTHAPANVTFSAGAAVLSLTADDATGFTGEPPPDEDAGPSSSEDGGEASNGGEAQGGAGGAGSGQVGGAGGGSAGTSSSAVNGSSAAPGAAPIASGDAARGQSHGGCSVIAGGSGRSAGSAGLMLTGLVALAFCRGRSSRSRLAQPRAGERVHPLLSVWIA
jgi:endo-1,3-1,4-beta-glycanase ExoK